MRARDDDVALRDGSVTPGGGARASGAEPPLMLKVLSELWGTVGRSRPGQRLLQRAGVPQLGRAWLRSSVLPSQRTRPDDVTVLMGVRDRSDYRILNALGSLRDQVYPHGTLTILVVDYGSRPTGARFVKEACERYDAKYLRVEAPGIWSRARCLNVGLRRVDTKFAMVSDADILHSPRYVADAVELLKEDPLSVVCSPMWDLPEASAPTLREAALEGAPLDLEALKQQCTARLDREFHSSIAVTYTDFYRLVRGYDEDYEGWGMEDADLMKRFRALGLRPKVPPSSSFYLHQWHPKFEGLTEAEKSRSVERNSAHYRARWSILRNGRGWGTRTGRV